MTAKLTARGKRIDPMFKKLATTALIGTLCAATSGCGLYPPYRVWASKNDGMARLAEAVSSKEIAVREAQAKFESSDFEARAEIRRAEGVAKANAIIGDSLKNNEAYLRYLYVNNLAHSKDQIIYVPTEAGLPVLEAGRHFAPAKAEEK